MDRIAYVGVGSNIDAYRNCLEGIRCLTEDERVTLLDLSSLYRTSPVSPVRQHDYLNCACRIKWGGDALDLLALLESIEQKLGRRRTVPQGPRTIDLDILLFDREILDTERLTIPHPRLHERKFVLVPCLEIDGSLIHPLLNVTFSQLLGSIGDEQKITLFKTLNPEDVPRQGRRGDSNLLSGSGR